MPQPSRVAGEWFLAMKGIAAAQDEGARKAAIGQVGEGQALLEETFQKISKGKSFSWGDHIGHLDIDHIYPV
ncbi:hypothetical protein ACLB2K_030731 [Fragaria x ananassa]